jgi:hypothetical protein
MPVEDPTFGCGTFLPGMGPGNFSDFDGGGTIDGGGGDDPDDPIDDGPGDLDDVIIDDDTGIVHPPPGPIQPRFETTYWICTQINQIKKECVSLTQDSDLAPPANSFLSQADCELICDDPGTPFTGGGGAPRPQPPGPRRPSTPGVAPPGPGGGATCKCTVTSHFIGPSIAVNGICTRQVIRFKTCVPLGAAESNHREEVAAYVNDGWQLQGSQPAGPVGCVCGSNDCTNVYQTLIKACPDDLDSTPRGGGAGGAFGAPPKDDQPGGPTTPGEDPPGPGGGVGGGTPGGTAKGPTTPGAGPPGPGGGVPGGTPGGTAKGPTTPGAGPPGPGGGTRITFGGGTDKSQDYDGGGPGDGGGGGGVAIDGTLDGRVFDTGGGGPGGGTRITFGGGADKGTVFDGVGGGPPGGGGFTGGTGTGIIFDGVGGGGPTIDGTLDGSVFDTDGGNGGGGGGGASSAPGKEGEGGFSDPYAGEGFNPAGEGVTSRHQESSRSIISKTIQAKEIDLNDPAIIATILRKKPSGIEDPEIAFNTTPPRPTIVPNSKNTNLFKDRINSNVEYVLSNRKLRGNWDSTRSAGVTPTTVYSSLKPEVQRILGEIRNYDGTLLSKNQIFSMLGTRILDGTISRVTLKYLQNFAESSKKRVPTVIKRSSNSKVNEVAALALVDRNKFTLDPAKAEGVMKNILPNWKTLASDIDKYIEVSVGGDIRKYYVKDDDTFVDRSTLGISDGDYFDVKVGSETNRLYAKSEKDHAFILPEVTRQKAISLLGGNPGRTLEVRASILSGIEFNYSLSAPRQDFYVLSCVLSSIDTKPSQGGSFLLKDTTAQYALAETKTPDGIREVNEYIKYKANHRVFMLDDEDIMLDYITATSSLTLKQTDILFDSPKENKTIPLLTRQIPWYIMVYPTNRSDLNIFNSKSKIISLEASGEVGRSLSCRTTIVPEFSKQQTNKFVRIRTDGKTAVDVYGNPNTQTRITQIMPTDKVFKTAYKERETLVSAEQYKPSRKKTGLRLLKEIITELDSNYLLGLNGIGKSLTEFDVFSRLTLQQFNLLSRLESFSIVKASIRNGIIANVKVVPPINRADTRVSFQKTQLVRRREGASADTFTPVKGTKSAETIIPPTTTGDSSFGPVTR